MINLRYSGLLMMSNNDHMTPPKILSDSESNSNSGSNNNNGGNSRYPDESRSSSNGSKRNTQSILNNENSSDGRETNPAARRYRCVDTAFPEGLKFQPKMIRENLIDLATAEVSYNSEFIGFSVV